MIRKIASWTTERSEPSWKSGRDVPPWIEVSIGIRTDPTITVIDGVKSSSSEDLDDTVNISEATYALVKDAIVTEDGVASTYAERGRSGVDLDHDEGTYQWERPGFVFTPRGKVQGEGEMEIYFVERA